MMYEQDKRAVESMVLCGVELEELQMLFTKFECREIVEVMERVEAER